MLTRLCSTNNNQRPNSNKKSSILTPCECPLARILGRVQERRNNLHRTTQLLLLYPRHRRRNSPWHSFTPKTHRCQQKGASDERSSIVQLLGLSRLKTALAEALTTIGTDCRIFSTNARDRQAPSYPNNETVIASCLLHYECVVSASLPSKLLVF